MAERSSDAAYAAVLGLIDRYVGNPDAQFELKRAVIEYGKQEAFHAIDSMTAATSAMQVRVLRGVTEGGE